MERLAVQVPSTIDGLLQRLCREDRRTRGAEVAWLVEQECQRRGIEVNGSTSTHARTEAVTGSNGKK